MNQHFPPIDDVYEAFVEPIANRGDAQRSLRVRCPLQQHRDEHPSCSLDLIKGVWFCHGCGGNGGVLDLVVAAGAATDHSSASQQLRSEFPQHTKTVGELTQSAYRAKEQHIARYLYTDGARTIFAVDRFESKDGRKRFVQSRPGDDGAFWSGRGVMEGIPRIPYRLNELRAAISRGDDIFITEGEKCAIILADLGLQATTSAQGANWKWTPEFAAYFSGAKRVFVLTDSDRPGREAAYRNAKMLLPISDDVRLIDFAPDRTDGYDVADWLEGKKVSDLIALAESTERLVADTFIAPALNIVRLADVRSEEVDWLCALGFLSGN